MSVSPIDYANTALRRITQQYKNKPLYRQLVTELCALTQTGIDDPLEYLFTVYDIDTAEGHNLDVIGIIVGQPRVLIDFDILEFFGYVGAANAGTYGSIYDANLGARYISQNESGSGGETTLSDPEYRVFIKARILRNFSVSTPEDIISSTNLILNIEKTFYIDGDMTFDLEAIGNISPNDLELIENYDIIPRPTGVNIGSVTSIPALIQTTGTGFPELSELPFFGRENDRFSWNNVLPAFSPPDNKLYFDGASWIIDSIVALDTWTHPTSIDYLPPKTGWVVSDFNSYPAPTISY